MLGTLLLGYCGFVLLDAELFQSRQSARFEQAIQSAQPLAASAAPPAASSEALAAPAGGMATSVDESAALGRIEISRIGLTAMIMEGIDNRTLRRAVGHFPGTELPGQQGNFVIAGHRDTFFRPLRNIRVNDEIKLTTLHGSYRYRVDSTRLTQPEDVSALDNSEDDSIMTLVTCFPFDFVGNAPQRFVVRAHLISETATPAVPRKEVATQLPARRH
jgi:sortase A